MTNLEKALGKPRAQWTRTDLVDFVDREGIRMVNFMYPADDGRLKTLNFTVNSLDYLRDILTWGERVDGSSLFPFIEAGNSDLYVVPRYATAFIDPFAEIPTLTMLASFFNKDGQPLPLSPEQTLRRACRSFHKATGLHFHAMGELEYYVIAPDSGLFPAADQKGYHASSPFAKFNDFRAECMDMIATCGGKIKYGHNEVGNFTIDGMVYEQNEIEFLPVDALEAADTLMLAKWIIRTAAARHGYDVTFAPKITAGKAGSGLHIHFKVVDPADGRNLMLGADGMLSETAKRAIVGILDHAAAITAVGNRVPTSYLRLVPHQEAPTSICWGDRNRSVLVRVPLGWTAKVDMCSQVNPAQRGESLEQPQRQTVELRSADGSADVYLLLAAMVAAATTGFKRADALKRADDLYVDVNIHSDAGRERLATLDGLPDSCTASAAAWMADRDTFEADGVFAPAMVDAIGRRLADFGDEHLRASLTTPEDMMAQVRRYWHCG